MHKQHERFWKLLEPEYERAVRFCRRQAGDRDRGDDLLQEALLTALARFDTLRDEAAFRPWLYRILVNTFRSTMRRPWWRRRAPWSPDVERSQVSADPSDRHYARRMLRRAFAALSTDEQMLVRLYELDDWSIAELAEVYGKSESAIKVRLHRARKKMKRALHRYRQSTTDERAAIELRGAACAVRKSETD